MTGASDLLTRDTVLTVGVSHEESSLTADHTTTSAPDHGTPSTVALTQCEQCGTVLDTGAMVAHTLTCPGTSDKELMDATACLEGIQPLYYVGLIQ